MFESIARCSQRYYRLFLRRENDKVGGDKLKISSFKFSELDEKNKPQLFKIFSATTFKIKQTAYEMWCLLRTFLVIIGSAIPLDKSAWELYILFIQLFERLCAEYVLRYKTKTEIKKYLNISKKMF